jgi:WD40 repeat protein
MDLTSDKKSL